ncbi:MAG: Nif3-like dinuclear metal center hexameric protein [Bacteroidales bacterium]|jgi:dinuclear metal center YbgI/SA1388 family protein|nr:Nif3-like dinuclear metal center hexameric protein [Bacteroidales bacterium]MDD2617287.1 Nif3-like dinuclear metal center hexameric protein [Bacteroidales bacterium]MDD4640581.1 Nif3-like dinuclear metal center hexameric protein [Bacteroidales bacterium]
MKVQDICKLIEDFAPLNLQEDYDNAGLILGDPTAQVKAVLVCLDVSEAVLDEALDTGCNMVVSHHPLIFKGIKSITGKNSMERSLIKAIQNKMAIYAGHTNVDAVMEGVNAKICEKMNLSSTSILVPRADTLNAGAGMTGFLEQDLDEKDFLKRVKQKFGCKMLRHSALTGRTIKKVAVCGGSGSEFITAAIAAGADAFITADIKYHQFAEVDDKLLLIDAGHYETEQFTKDLFVELISKNIANFAVHSSQREKNPVYYC